MDYSIPCDGQAQLALPRGLCTSGLPFSVHCWGIGSLHFYLRKVSSESLLSKGEAGRHLQEALRVCSKVWVSGVLGTTANAVGPQAWPLVMAT